MIMMFTQFKILLLALTVIIFFSCTDNKKDELKNGDEEIALNQNIQTEKSAKKPSIIESQKLTEFLPSSVPGTKKTPYKTGLIDDDEMKVSIASCEFVFPNNGFLKFSINDYGSKNFIPEYELRLFDYPPTESGKVTEEFVITNGKGYTLWDDFKKEGMLFALLSDRFILRIDATRIPVTSVKLQEYIKYFKIKELLSTK
jgi:hypothetical protein